MDAQQRTSLDLHVWAEKKVYWAKLAIYERMIVTCSHFPLCFSLLLSKNKENNEDEVACVTPRHRLLWFLVKESLVCSLSLFSLPKVQLFSHKYSRIQISCLRGWVDKREKVHGALCSEPKEGYLNHFIQRFMVRLYYVWLWLNICKGTWLPLLINIRFYEHLQNNVVVVNVIIGMRQPDPPRKFSTFDNDLGHEEGRENKRDLCNDPLLFFISTYCTAYT
jgi:hypothetical protein